MAEVITTPNPYESSGIEDLANTGAMLDWWTAAALGLVSYPWQNPTAAPTGTYVGGTLTGDIGSNPFNISFGDPNSIIPPYDGPLGGNNGLPTTFPGFDELLASRPTQYPGSQWPNIAIGIPGVVGIGAGGLVAGGLIDLLGGGSSGGGSTQQGGGGGIAPLPGDYGSGGGATVGPGLGGQEQTPQSTVYPLPGGYGGDGATVGPGLGGEQGNPSTILPPPGIFPDSGTTVTPGEGSPAGAGTIVPPVTTNPTTPPNVPGENSQPNTIYAPLWNAFNPGTAMPPTMNPTTGSTPPTQLPLDPSTSQPPLNRNYYNEGAQSLYDLQRLGPGFLGLYGHLAGGYAGSDLSRYQGLLGGLGTANNTLSGMAADQTRYANRTLRGDNLQDVNTYGQQALALRQQVNPELYGSLNRLDMAAGQQAGQGGSSFLNALLGQGGLKPSEIQTTLEQQAQQGLALGRNLSAEDIRMSQQAAREAGSARGRLNDASTMAAEVLNRDAISRQRENERRAFAQSVDQAGFGQRAAAQQGNIGLGQAVGGMDMARQQQGFNQLFGAAQMRSANAFDPFATLLGQQYGMQTSNVGNNQQLFNQGTGFSSGAFGNQYVQQAFNPYNNYSADVYGSNFNAANARSIANSNNSAASDAAKQALLGQALGSLFKTGVQTNWRFGF